MLPLSVFARTLDEIEQDIQEKESTLDKFNKELTAAKEKLDSSNSRKENASGRLEELEAEISYIHDQLEYNKIKTKVIEDQKNIKELEKEQQETKFEKQLVNSYLFWQSEGKFSYTAFLNTSDPVKTGTYLNAIASEEQGSLETLANDLNKVSIEFETFTKESEDLNNQILGLEEERETKIAELEKLNTIIAQEGTKLSSTKQSIDQTKIQLDLLSDEQRALQNNESSILDQNPSGISGTKPIVAGEYYFSGRGRDRYQGHGIGFSQNGALGAALAGWNYKQILEFYYQGTQVITYTAKTSIDVQGHGNMDVNTYVAGLGEVPSLGCENLGVSFGQVGYWGCWPKEVIKAQVVAARTYGVTFSGAICTSASCQVYNGGEAKRWAADETSYEVVAKGGAPIRAFYSAQNNQGAGTANNDTVWANREGNGTAYSYLRSVNDNGFYYPASYSGCNNSDCAKWVFRTNSYTISEIQDMLEWAAFSAPTSKISSSDKNFVAGILSNVGSLNGMSFERDPSQRVNKVVINGTGGSRVMGGWFFKSIWNIYVDAVKPKGEADYIYSLTFYMLQG
jgi:SpoIID/LytB domain protein